MVFRLAIYQIAVLHVALRLGVGAGPLAQAEDDEFGGLDRRHADFDDQLTQVADFGRVQLFVTFDVERLILGGAKECAAEPEGAQEGVGVAPDLGPQHAVVRLEDHPLHTSLQGSADDDEQAADVDVTPGAVTAQRAGAPDADATAREGADAVDADGVQHALLALGQVQLHGDGAADYFVGGSFVEANFGVHAVVDAHDVSAGRHQFLLLRAVAEVGDLDPGVVHGGIRGVVVDVLAPLFGLLGVEARRGVEDSEAVLEALAIGDHRRLHQLNLFLEL